MVWTHPDKTGTRFTAGQQGTYRDRRLGIQGHSGTPRNARSAEFHYYFAFQKADLEISFHGKQN